MASKRKSKDDISVPSLTHRQYEDDVYFMSVALMFAKKSPDPSTKVGACIVNEGKIVGVGFNMMPNGCEEAFIKLWKRDDEDRLKTKYPYVCHAELNAIMNKTSVDVKGCTIYVTLFPCNECAKLIIQSGIRKVLYLSNKYADTEDNEASVELLNRAGVTHRPFTLKQEVRDLLDSINPFAE
ncbi:deoxycytidylate deaminase-like [Hemibagrus wyckioides]|nr:deoxycytidylate deaminase-like [Hemibagrus wyckioides]XP_058233599.1 deoxycytidylate deaminase-like [Hemibagrus wyckioides]